MKVRCPRCKATDGCMQPSAERPGRLVCTCCDFCVDRADGAPQVAAARDSGARQHSRSVGPSRRLARWTTFGDVIFVDWLAVQRQVLLQRRAGAL